MAANPDISLIDYLPPVKVTPNEEKSSADSPKLKPALTPIEKKLAGKNNLIKFSFMFENF